MLEVVNEIRSETRGRRVDAAVAALAVRQHGAVARSQLAALGMGQGAIQHRISCGRLHRVFRGVFAVGWPGLGLHGRWMAAILSCGAGATLSHRSAASLWGIAPYGGSRIDIIVCGARRRQRAGIHLHGDALDAADRASRYQIPATALHRTLLDLAGVVDRRRLERAVEEAERLQLLDIAVIDRLLRRSSGRRGVVALRAAIEGCARSR